MIGSAVRHYRILEKLGEGGMGVVYKAEDTKLDRMVALKFLPSHNSVTSEDKQRFVQEAKAAAALNHVNICTIYGIEDDGSKPFIAMEFVDGVTLREKIRSGLPDRKATIEYVIQIAAALQEAHNRDIVHRDVKSDNIMVSSKGQIKVMDFGLAKLKNGLSSTKTRSTAGTTSYMSPEQIQGLDVDHRTDLWALGVVLYELLTGQPPFVGEHDPAVIYKILNVDPKAIQSADLEVPGQLQALVSRLLQKDPQKRPSSASEIIDLLTKQSSSPAPIASNVKSIAVLYFENMSSERESDYFCAGITEDIITDLSKIKDLRVVSRSDVLLFRDKQVNTREVGDMLRVNYVLEGSVRKAGNKMRITAQLIDVQAGFQLWAERFDRLVDDIFDVQTEVAERIAAALKVSLTDSELESLVHKPTDDLRAYDFYMRGRELLYRRGRKNNEAAIQMFENAIAIDPSLASAYAGLGEGYSCMYEWYDGSPKWLGKAIEMNEQALAHDPMLIEARFGIAMVYFHQKRSAEARRLLESILAENSQFYPACLRLGMIMESSQDYNSALKYYRCASTLKPYDDDPWIRLDGIFRKMGDFQAADEAARKVIEVTSRKLEASLDDLIVMSRLAGAYARFGSKEEASTTLKAVFERDPTDGLVLYNCSSAYALLGEVSLALISLRRAFESGFRRVTSWAQSDTAFDSLRLDPAFTGLIAELEYH